MIDPSSVAQRAIPSFPSVSTNLAVSLANQGYFDGTSCHRLTTGAGLQVLQCGDGYSAEFWTNGLWKVTECSLSPHDGLEDVSDLIADVEHLEEPMIRVTMFVG